jgi:translocation protein SEC62
MATPQEQPPQGQQGGTQINFQFPAGQKPTPEQIQAMQRQLAIDAQKNGMTVPQFVEKLKAQAIAQQQAQQQAAAQQQAQQQQQQQPIQPGPPKPEALAVANFLKKQDLKVRTCILNGQRKDMFKGRISRRPSL